MCRGSKTTLKKLLVSKTLKRLKSDLRGIARWSDFLDQYSILSVLRPVVPPHSSFSDLLLQLQRAKLLLAPLLVLPQLLAVLVHALTHPAFVAPERKLSRVQPRLPVARQRRHVGLAKKSVVLLEVAAWAQSITGDNMNTVSGQALAEGAFVAGAGVHTCV